MTGEPEGNRAGFKMSRIENSRSSSSQSGRLILEDGQEVIDPETGSHGEIIIEGLSPTRNGGDLDTISVASRQYIIPALF
jgi:hypothetical protein